LDGRSIVVGHAPSAGMFGEVGRGQYKMPEDISMQFPTGKSISTNGQVVLEGIGVIPDVLVPITLESAMGEEDTVLTSAIEALEKLIP
jgi:C-terminal processing protease CtpA/Prc